MTSNERYVQIGIYFERALNGLWLEPALKGAIKAMQICPEQIRNIKSFNATLWELIETILNCNVIPVEDKERQDFFLAGCALLEKFDEGGCVKC